MSVLAEQLKFTRSRLTHAVIRLEHAGYVRRRDDPAEQRGQLVELT
jgi:DNA-binding MarR family transcriptional regulator